jgi:hypothetical protein
MAASTWWRDSGRSFGEKRRPTTRRRRSRGSTRTWPASTVSYLILEGPHAQPLPPRRSIERSSDACTAFVSSRIWCESCSSSCGSCVGSGSRSALRAHAHEIRQVIRPVLVGLHRRRRLARRRGSRARAGPHVAAGPQRRTGMVGASGWPSPPSSRRSSGARPATVAEPGKAHPVGARIVDGGVNFSVRGRRRRQAESGCQEARRYASSTMATRTRTVTATIDGRPRAGIGGLLDRLRNLRRGSDF